MGGKHFSIKILIGVFLLLSLNCSQSLAEITDFYELKKALETPGEATIQLEKDIFISDMIYVKGKKLLDGNGYMLRRGETGGTVYKGTLFKVKNADLEVREVTISGNGTDNQVVYDSLGRLIDVRQGSVVLGSMAVLTGNRNKKDNSDGGGAVLVQEGGVFIMQKGSGITENQNVAGGAGIRVEAGGTFRMLGGCIEKNRVDGIGAVEGFDGRGGGIYNCGNVRIEKGEILDNQVVGFSRDNVSYGGVGGALYNRGECEILGGTIKGNRASYGGGAIYTDVDALLRITGGIIKNNKADTGKNLFLAGGTWDILELSGIYPKQKVKRTEVVTKRRNKSQGESKQKKTKEVKRENPEKENSKKKELLTQKYKVVKKKKEKETEKEPEIKVEREPALKKGYIRFLSVDENKDEVEEVWYFDSQKLQEIKNYMLEQEDPFSVETNRGFWSRFIKCCIKGGK